MTGLHLFSAFLVAASILTVTPGIDTAMVLRSATVDGRRPASFAAIGVAIGCLIWGAAVSLGLGALLRASELAYTAVKMAGAAYLIWLGTRLVFKPRIAFDQTKGPGAATGEWDAFQRGFLTNLLNPKVGVFYVTFLPQFVPTGSSVAGYTFFLAGVHVALTLLWFTVLVAATVPLGRFLRQPKAVRALDRLTGGVFVAFGVKLAASTSR